MQAFDKAALNYDLQFTYSVIGMKLRHRVWQYLDGVMRDAEQLNILELNCGTGEDAIHFAKQGHRIRALDVSGEMIAEAEKKMNALGIPLNIQFDQLDMKNLDQLEASGSIDLVFSNFGGLNCLHHADMKAISGSIAQTLRGGGRFIAVVMGKFCLWETGYFLAKAKWANLFRRNTNEKVVVFVDGSPVDTWYYSPDDFTRANKQHFRKIHIKPLGLFLPPPYLENFFGRHPQALRMLERLEDIFCGIPIAAYFSDHYIIDLQVR